MPPNGLRAERRMVPVQGNFQTLELVSLQAIFSVYLDPLGRYDSSGESEEAVTIRSESAFSARASAHGIIATYKTAQCLGPSRTASLPRSSRLTTCTGGMKFQPIVK